MQPAASGRHVLLVGHAEARRRGLEAALRQRGYRTSAATRMDRVPAALAADPPDLLLLCAASAPGPALGLLQAIRHGGGLPVVLVCEPGEHSVTALEAGADDCLAPSMPLPEMLARIGAVLRRAAPARPGPPGVAPRLIEGGWRLVASRRLLVAASGEASIPLTGAEFELLRLLEQAGGEPVDRDTISRLVFRRAWSATDRAVDGLVKRLRRKLATDAIASVRGVGYALRFDDAPGEAAADPGRPAAGLRAEVEICAHQSVAPPIRLQSTVVKNQAQH